MTCAVSSNSWKLAKPRPWLRHQQCVGNRTGIRVRLPMPPNWKDHMKQSTLAAAAAIAGGAYLAKRIVRATRRINFHGRNVLITGGSRGLGLVLARQFAAEGADITLLGLDDENLERAVIDIAARGADVLGIPCD